MRTQRFLRSLVLAVGSVAAVGVLFMLYAYSEGDLKGRATPRPSPTVRPQSAADAGGTPPPEMRIGKEQIPIGGGENVRHVMYDKEGKVRGEIELTRWQPVGDRRNEFEVEKPVIRLRNPEGQIIRVTADAGRLVTRSADPRSFDPRSGRLEGNVRITLDRLTETQREQLLPAERDTPTPDRLVELQMQNLEFDMEFARVETSGPFKIESAEASVSGTGLSLDYNELEGRIEELNIAEQGRIEVRGENRGFVLNTGSTPPSKAATPELSPTPSPTPTPKPELSGDDELPLLEIDEPARQHRPRPLDSYTAVFTGDVDIAQFEQKVEVARLLASRLELLFDFGERERGAARRAPGAPAEIEGPPAPPSFSAPSPDDRVVVKWSGPLHVTSERLPMTGEGKEGHPTGRMHVVATGSPVRVISSKPEDDARKSPVEQQIVGDKLIYHHETGFAQIFGSPQSPAHVQAEGMGELHGPFIELNREKGTARAAGPGGKLVSARAASLAGGSSRSEAPLEVRFEKSFDATFVKIELPPEEGKEKGHTKEVLRTAAFDGAVELDHGADRIRCGKLTMEFETDPNYNPYPTQALMLDNVSVAQDKRFITAKERLLSRFKLVEREKPDFDLTKARARAITEGHDPDTIDWIEQKRKYEERREFATVMQTMNATGGVEVRDPKQRLEIHSGTLDCNLAGNGNIEKALVTPAADGQSFVGMGDFSIAAPAPIPFDSVNQTLRVTGPGRMIFPSKQDFDGRELDKPVPISVRWAERMNFEGAANKAEFVGAVHVESPDSTYDCGALRVEFRDAPKASVAAASERDWWIFAPLAKRADGTTDEGEWQLGGGSQSFEKDPVRFFAMGGVKAINQNIDPRDRKLRSRVLITGPAMAVDLEQHFMNVDGSGSLLIEDYRPASRKAPAALPGGQTEGVVTPLGEWVSGGSSQTYVAWEQSMRYRYRDNVADFDRNVTLVSSRGNKMKLAPRGNLQPSEGEKGRESRLNCQHLHVEFERSEANKPAGRNGANQMSGNEVRSFEAKGQVYFFDSDISAIATSLLYSRNDNLLQIIGTDGAPAEIYDQRQRFAAVKGTRFVWDRATNRLWGPNTRATIN